MSRSQQCIYMLHNIYFYIEIILFAESTAGKARDEELCGNIIACTHNITVRPRFSRQTCGQQQPILRLVPPSPPLILQKQHCDATQWTGIRRNETGVQEQLKNAPPKIIKKMYCAHLHSDVTRADIR